MKRNIFELAEREFDLVIVGGGIFGACIAWDAAQRGLTTALIEKGDFAHATSANCFKIAHGGIRYLQHGDLPRVRQSSHERSALLRIAPHQVSPLPIVVPTYGRGMKGKAFLRTGVLLYDLVTFDRNRGIPDPQRRIQNGKAISAEECIELYPGIERDGLTGGVIFADGQMYSPPRLALSFLLSAVDAGAVVANYVEATSFIRKGNDVVGVWAHDMLNDEPVMIHGKHVINAAGPWAESLLRTGGSAESELGLTFSRDAAIVVNRPLVKSCALALQGKTRDPDALMNRGNRHLFAVPWRGYTLVGVWHVVHKGAPDSFTVTEEEVNQFLDEFSSAWSGSDPITMKDVSMVNAGLTLFGDNDPGSKDLSYGKRSRIVDHAESYGINGLTSVVGVRYTMGRGTAEQAVDLVLQKLGRKRVPCQTAVTPVHGGQIESFDDFSQHAIAKRPPMLSQEVMDQLVRNHGSEYQRVLRHVSENPTLAAALGGSSVIRAEVVHAVREEMAWKLSDVIFRRTELGTAGFPGEEALAQCADLMAAELGWNAIKKKMELQEAQAAFPSFITRERRRANAYA